VALLRRLGLSYGAVDLILTPDDRFVFLEINPNGQYLWVQRATGLPIGEAVCDTLVDGAPVPAAHAPMPLEGSRHDVD
jgi:glutathione synthase/RimK-type ligase-like ATP-grasp enzyme